MTNKEMKEELPYYLTEKGMDEKVESFDKAVKFANKMLDNDDRTVTLNDVLNIDFKRIILTCAKPADIIREKIKQLPSVTPQRLKSHWEYRDIANSTITGYWCDNCHIGSSKAYDYCPSCGAYMVGDDNGR